MAVTVSKKHPSTDIKEGELIFVATHTSDASINYQIAAIKVANIADPVAIVFDPRQEFNPSKKWFHKTSEYLVALDGTFFTTELAEKFASKAELGALDNTVVSNIFGASSLLFTGTNATALGDSSITTTTKITDVSIASTGSSNNNSLSTGGSGNVGTANASTTGGSSKGFWGSIPTWAYILIVPVVLIALYYLLKRLTMQDKKKGK